MYVFHICAFSKCYLVKCADENVEWNKMISSLAPCSLLYVIRS